MRFNALGFFFTYDEGYLKIYINNNCEIEKHVSGINFTMYEKVIIILRGLHGVDASKRRIIIAAMNI